MKAPKPFFKGKIIDVQALLASLTPNQLAECVEIECYGWPPRQFKEVMANLGPEQVALLESMSLGSAYNLEQLRNSLQLDSTEEVEKVFSDLRSQLREMGIHPQEVYYADFKIRRLKRGIERIFWLNWAFGEGGERAEDPKRWAKQKRQERADEKRFRESMAER